MLHTREVQNWAMSFIMGVQIASRIGILNSNLTGNQQIVTSKSLGPSQETCKEATKTKTSSIGESLQKFTELDFNGR